MPALEGIRTKVSIYVYVYYLIICIILATLVSVVKNSPASTGDMGSVPSSERSPGEGNGNPLQDSCLGNHMAGGDWLAIVHGVTKS